MSDAVHQTRIVVLDDDPTGSQTVHGCLLLTRWDPDTLCAGLRDRVPLFFVLTNTRAMDSETARRTTQEVCRNLRDALAREGMDARDSLIVISRSDSTLRGHYPAETDAINAELGPFDAHFLVPAFFQGGRFTREGVHYVSTPEGAVPAHQTPFARDSVFGYSTSVLADYVAEKTAGRVPAAQVLRIPRSLSEAQMRELLSGLHGNRCCVVDAETQEDLDRFANACREAAAAGKHFLFRSAASLITSFARLPPQAVPTREMHRYVPPGRAGLIMVGTHVPLSSAQLSHLLRHRATEIAPIELDVNRLPHDPAALRGEAQAAVNAALGAGLTAVVFTSRTERQFPTPAERLAFGAEISQLLMDILDGLATAPGFIISKGGITSHDVLSRGLDLSIARVVGQILPGCSVVLTPEDHRLGSLPVVIFPGNVGTEDSLTTVLARLTSAVVQEN